jgi:predicted ATP-grasp superfamily ATP-dependent carboligase
MKLFIYEHITSGALINQSLLPSLAHEGDEMLCAVVNDCIALSEHTIHLMRDERLPLPQTIANNDTVVCEIISSADDYKIQWQHALENHDAVLVIAPETDNVLEILQKDVSNYQIHNLGCTSEAIATTGNKFKCYTSLTKAGITTPESYLAHSWQSQMPVIHGYIAKPLDGAGCLDTFHFDSARELQHYLDQCPKTLLDNTIIQPYILGDNISLSVLMTAEEVYILAINSQNIEQQYPMLTLKSCHVNGYDNCAFTWLDASRLAERIKHAIPGLRGFIGIDIIVSESGASVIDINPRLTSSYIGLAKSLSTNPMALLLSQSEQAMIALPEPKLRQAVNVTL